MEKTENCRRHPLSLVYPREEGRAAPKRERKRRAKRETRQSKGHASRGGCAVCDDGVIRRWTPLSDADIQTQDDDDVSRDRDNTGTRLMVPPLLLLHSLSVLSSPSLSLFPSQLLAD